MKTKDELEKEYINSFYKDNPNRMEFAGAFRDGMDAMANKASEVFCQVCGSTQCKLDGTSPCAELRAFNKKNAE